MSCLYPFHSIHPSIIVIVGPEVQRIYSAEQIAVPPALPGILKAWTKEVIRANPQDIYSFSANWFKDKLAAVNRGRE